MNIFVWGFIGIIFIFFVLLLVIIWYLDRLVNMKSYEGMQVIIKDDLIPLEGVKIRVRHLNKKEVGK